jgi:hypothetical protein
MTASPTEYEYWGNWSQRTDMLARINKRGEIIIESDLLC